VKYWRVDWFKGAVNVFEIDLNRIPAIRVFAVRVTPIFTNKIGALNTLKMGLLLGINVMLPQGFGVNLNQLDWWNCSSTPSRFKPVLIWLSTTCASILITEVDIFDYLKNQSCLTFSR
jgi:hypothetical protein